MLHGSSTAVGCGPRPPVMLLPRPSPFAPRARPRASRHRLSCRAVDSQQQQQQVDRASPAAATAEPAAEQPAAAPHLECFDTGLGVECRIVTDGPEHVPVASPDEEAQAMLEQAKQLPHQSPTSVLDVLLLISPFFFWGTSMVAMKQLAPHTTPLLVASWRLLPAGAALLAWAAASGRKTPTDPRAWLAMALFGLGCLVEGLQRTSAGLGSVIIDSQPLTVALLASLLFGEKLGSAGVAGLFIGVAGLFLLEVPPSVLTSLPDSLAGAAFQLASSSGDVGNSAADAAAAAAAAASSSGAADLAAAAAGAAAAGGDSSGSGGGWSLWDSGEWWMLLAAQSMAVGTVMVRWVAKYCDPVVATGWHMLLGGVPLLALAAWQEGAEAPERLAQLTGLDALLLLYMSLLGSAASYGVFFYNASRGNLTALSSLTFLTPMFAAAGGYLALGETLTPLQLAGASVTLGAVALINNHSHSEEGEPRGPGSGSNGSGSGGSKQPAAE
ncbi:hypothetical protein CHLNCDRAFT_142001 [Chlorella variabilis]|uniref:EamA domain-containing protein n=1 Tax=Chlorella variabilis TaxID=554065 RepID=E1Z7I4_CHLVA|nr:hypothetical protein CHLNCDRAFT_142001 [Chlorella variabilis]EFN57925.1 hypothetical protein CHLNCDRAFT_142001 [Chlorella variabilis]|eukprot:XP_005850027.1 hypothetical protein CHLNCDRAFT_142001 [Chlorella variabilis]